MIEAVVKAREHVRDISLDIYGKGGEEERLRELIDKLGCGAYVRLMGQQRMDEIYKNYEAYVSASTSEGFGLTLMEAIGSGLPVIGFDVPYGNQTFIDEGENGYRIPVHDKMEKEERTDKLAERMVRLFTVDDRQSFIRHSYQKAQAFLTAEVEKKWINLLNQTI